MQTLRTILVMLAVCFAAGLLFVNIYNSMVDAPNWGINFPESIQATRNYYHHTANPGTFFRLFSPTNQIIGLVALILCWMSDKKVRYLLLIAVVFSITADVFTFAYFYPRNGIMFSGPIEENLDGIRTAWEQWSTMNWVRSAVIGIALIFDLAALNRLIGVTSNRETH